MNDVVSEERVIKRQNNADFLDFEMLEVPETLIEAEETKEEVKGEEQQQPEQVIISTVSNSRN